MKISNLHIVNPYDNFDPAQFPSEVKGWNSNAPIFKKIIDTTRPALIVEIGSWLGASAIHMAGLLKAYGLSQSKIVCVDTWLGSLDFWTDQLDAERYGALDLKNGYPSVYYKFLANVVRAGHQDMIIPFPQNSMIAARWFAEKNFKPEMIYIDGSHDYKDVADDLTAWWPLLGKDYYILGDDYKTWEGVKLAVRWWRGPRGPVVVEPSGHWYRRKI